MEESWMGSISRNIGFSRSHFKIIPIKWRSTSKHQEPLLERNQMWMILMLYGFFNNQISNQDMYQNLKLWWEPIPFISDILRATKDTPKDIRSVSIWAASAWTAIDFANIPATNSAITNIRHTTEAICNLRFPRSFFVWN